jgi:hypothetical protein
MKIYQGNDMSKATVRLMWEKNIGILVSGQYRNVSGLVPYYALDNGCFGAAVGGYAWDPWKFLKLLDKYRTAIQAPDFVVCPDIPFQGLKSLEFSRYWIRRLPDIGTKYYLAVQDGMTEGDVLPILGEGFGAIFVGGSLNWKHETAAAWVKFANDNGLACHIGRVGGTATLEWALEISANSIDSTAFGRFGKFWKIDAARKGASA